jgi:hypothetical protein
MVRVFVSIVVAAVTFTAGSVVQAAPYPPIEAAWFVGDPVTGSKAPPTHFSLGSGTPHNQIIPIAGARLFPNVLVELEAGASSAIDVRTDYPAGTQLFQLPRRANATFCTLGPVRRQKYHCLIDMDGDGRLDSVATAGSAIGAPPLLALGTQVLPLAAPVAVRPVPRESVKDPMTISLVYIGQRRMTRPDRTFMVYINDAGGGFSTSRNMSLYLDKLRPTETLAGVKLVNVVRNDKRIEFDVASGFESGPFEPVNGGQKPTEWGF